MLGSALRLRLLKAKKEIPFFSFQCVYTSITQKHKGTQRKNSNQAAKKSQGDYISHLKEATYVRGL
jgi:hypothetical protein